MWYCLTFPYTFPERSYIRCPSPSSLLARYLSSHSKKSMSGMQTEMLPPKHISMDRVEVELPFSDSRFVLFYGRKKIEHPRKFPIALRREYRLHSWCTGAAVSCIAHTFLGPPSQLSRLTWSTGGTLHLRGGLILIGSIKGSPTRLCSTTRG